MKLILKHKNSGFSLVELLIAIFLGAYPDNGYLQPVFVMQNQSYVNQNLTSEMQQNVRMAMDILTADLRMAGFGFSINGDYKKTSNTVDYASNTDQQHHPVRIV